MFVENGGSCLGLNQTRDMRSVIQLLGAEGATLMEIYTKILANYGTPCISETKVYEWVEKYKNEVQIVEELPRPETVADAY